MRSKLRRSKYSIEVKNIFPKGWFMLIFVIELLLALMMVYYYKISENIVAVLICMIIFYIIAVSEFAIRYIIKNNYFKRKGFSMGVNTPYYHNKTKMLVISNILMALACSAYVVVCKSSGGIEMIYENYWIWFALILFLICFEPFNDITTGFCDTFVLTDRCIVNLADISEIRIVNEKATTKGKVCEIEMYKDGNRVGIDRFFEDDLIRMKRIVMSI